MVHVVAGTDTYGRVKCVLGTPIVTKFAMFQLLPLYPARVPSDAAVIVRQFAERGQDDPICDRIQLVHSLVAARASLAEGNASRPRLESITDATLSQLRRDVAIDHRAV